VFNRGHYTEIKQEPWCVYDSQEKAEKNARRLHEQHGGRYVVEKHEGVFAVGDEPPYTESMASRVGSLAHLCFKHDFNYLSVTGQYRGDCTISEKDFRAFKFEDGSLLALYWKQTGDGDDDGEWATYYGNAETGK